VYWLPLLFCTYNWLYPISTAEPLPYIHHHKWHSFVISLVEIWRCKDWVHTIINIVTCRRFCAWLVRRVLDWRIRFIDTLYTELGTTGKYSAIAHLRTLHFTVTHALGFSVFTSRILPTDLSQSHCHFKSHTKCSCQSDFFLAILKTRPISWQQQTFRYIAPGRTSRRTPSSTVPYCFRRTRAVSSAQLSSAQLSLLPVSAGLLLVLFFEPEDESDMFLRNVELSLDYAAL
jgi:hypothetical protein